MQSDNVKFKVIFFTIIFFGLFGWAESSEAVTYYVSTAGSDSNNGTSTNTPWQTISKVNGSSFSAGDFILFKKGETWREQLNVPSSGSAGNPITFGAYGTGEKPIINGADLVTTWEVYSGNVWQATVTTEPKILIFDNVIGTHAASFAALAAEHDWFWAGSVLSVYHVGDPSSGHAVEAGSRRPIHTNGADYITYDGLELVNSNSQGLYFAGSNYNIFRNSVITRSAGHGIYSGNTNGNATIEYNEIYNVGRMGGGGTGNGIYTHSDVAGPNIVQHNYFHDIGGNSLDHGVYDTGSGGSIYRYNRFKDIVGTCVKVAYNPVNPEIYYNRLESCGAGAVLVDKAAGAEVYNNTTYNCGVYPGTSPYAGMWYVGNTGKSATFKNNIIVNSGNAFKIQTSSEGFTSNNNIVYGQLYYGDYVGAAYNFADWKMNTLQDANSVNADPLFVSTGTPDFRLLSFSLAINAGTNVGLTTDYLGNAIVGLPDIGAYEYASGDTTAPAAPSGLQVN